jgi:hypothetical protein
VSSCDICTRLSRTIRFHLDPTLTQPTRSMALARDYASALPAEIWKVIFSELRPAYGSNRSLLRTLTVCRWWKVRRPIAYRDAVSNYKTFTSRR